MIYVGQDPPLCRVCGKELSWDDNPPTVRVESDVHIECEDEEPEEATGSSSS